MKAEHVVEPTRPYEITSRGNEAIYDDGYLRIERDNYYVECGGQPIALMRKEFLIVWRLAQNPQRVVPSEEIWTAAWGVAANFNSGSFRVYMSRLRHRLAPYGLSIESMVGVGYRLLLPAREAKHHQDS
jgi:two-component system OmpR family response regulator